MEDFTELTQRVREVFDALNAARDAALGQARTLTRLSALTIRAIHRDDRETAKSLLAEGAEVAASLKNLAHTYPELYYTGYTLDALKEYVEANVTCAIIENKPLPAPDALGVEVSTYLNGLAEVTGELRRRTLDILREGYSSEAERLLGWMDEIYNLLVTVDYPDALTNGLRRQTDLARGIVERTRGDLTISVREEKLQKALEQSLRAKDV